MRIILSVALMLACAPTWAEKNPILPQPYQTPSVDRHVTVLGWPAGKMPVAPEGYQVSVFANLDSPRSLYLLPTGDVLVSQAKKVPGDKGENSPNRITLFKMNGPNLAVVRSFLPGVVLPFGMALFENELFIAEPTRVLKFKFENDAIVGPGIEIAQLAYPQPGRHWTRHLLLSPDGSKIYIGAGSASNVGEDGDPLDPKTASIMEMNRDGSDFKVYASGIRNPVQLAWEPTTGALWSVVNERDELGDGLVPDYITSIRKDGFYGWPYFYWGAHEDPRRAGQKPELAQQSIVPDFSVGAHTAALGITFTSGSKMAAPFNSGALISQHGSWNSSTMVGYKVIYVPFENGQAVDGERDFLTGFIADAEAFTAYGRPVSSVVLSDGTVLVADDAGNKIWKVSPVASARKMRVRTLVP